MTDSFVPIPTRDRVDGGVRTIAALLSDPGPTALSRGVDHKPLGSSGQIPAIQGEPGPDIAGVKHEYPVYAIDPDGTHYFIERHAGGSYSFSHNPHVLFAAFTRLFGPTP